MLFCNHLLWLILITNSENQLKNYYIMVKNWLSAAVDKAINL